MSLGPDYGALQINGYFKYEDGLSKDKITYLEKSKGIYRDGNAEIIKEGAKMIGGLRKFTTCLGCCCPCVSFGINHSITTKRKASKAQLNKI